MDKTKKCRDFSISVVLTLILLSFICVIIGCSSKKDETNAEKSRPAKTEVDTPFVTQEPKLPILPSPEVNQAVKINKAVEVNQTVDVNLNQETSTPQAAKKNNRRPKVKVSTNVVLNEFNRTKDSEKKIELLGSLSDMAIDQDPCVIGVVQTAVADKNPDVALAAIELLQGYENPETLPAITKAMAHSNEEVRQTAVNLLLDINDPQTGKLLSDALSDKSEDIRSTALDQIKYKDKQVQFKVLETAISSPYSDVKEESVFMLQYVGGPQAVDTLIEALRDKNAEFREEVGSAISALIDKEFESYQEAKSWWKKNRNKYDEDLSLIEDEQKTQGK